MCFVGKLPIMRSFNKHATLRGGGGDRLLHCFLRSAPAMRWFLLIVIAFDEPFHQLFPFSVDFSAQLPEIYLGYLLCLELFLFALALMC